MGSFNNFMQLGIVPPLNGSLRSSKQSLFQFSPMFSILKHIFANSEIFIDREVGLVYIGPEVVKVSFPDLFGSIF